MSVCVSVCVSICLRMCICACKSVYACTYMGMCVCIRAFFVYEDACMCVIHTSYNHRLVFVTGETGKYVFRLSPESTLVNYDQKCYDWYSGEMKRKWLVQFYWSWTQVCPCDRRLAVMDNRWREYSKQLNEEKISDRDCFYEKMPLAQSTQVAHAPITLHTHTSTTIIATP